MSFIVPNSFVHLSNSIVEEMAVLLPHFGFNAVEFGTTRVEVFFRRKVTDDLYAYISIIVVDCCQIWRVSEAPTVGLHIYLSPCEFAHEIVDTRALRTGSGPTLEGTLNSALDSARWALAKLIKGLNTPGEDEEEESCPS